IGTHATKAEFAKLIAERWLGSLGGGGEEQHDEERRTNLEAMATRRKAELVETRALSPSVRSLTFRTVDGSAIGHKAGQYLDLIVPTARGLPFRRSYSIASPPDSRANLFE